MKKIFKFDITAEPINSPRMDETYDPVEIVSALVITVLWCVLAEVIGYTEALALFFLVMSLLQFVWKLLTSIYLE
jgi:hypothetical protein